MNGFGISILTMRAFAAITSLISTINAIIVLANAKYDGHIFMPAIALGLLILLVIWTFIAVADVFAGLHEKYIWISRLMWFSVPYGLLTAYLVTSAYLSAILYRSLIIAFTWVAVCNMITDAFMINCLSVDSLIIST
ncbi:putative integral membrane protein [Acanthocheilonema viteae]